MTSSRHVRSLIDGAISHSSELGSITRLTSDSFPILNRLSIKRLLLAPDAIREPHWHANANELTYCVAGTVLVSIIDNLDAVASFTISAGQMFYADVGSLHPIENIGSETAELILGFSHEEPKDFSLHASFGAMSDAVLGNTYDLPAADLAALPRDTSSAWLVRRAGPPTVPSNAAFVDPHKFDLGAQSPPIDHPYGTARVSRTQFWKTLKDISMYEIRVRSDGMREPHWHPDTAEMGYVQKGQARMTILDPDGTTDTYLLKAGDTYFVPRSYPHHIEALDEEIRFLIFFDQPTPGDIGYRLTASAVSPDVMAATFGVARTALPKFPSTPVDPLIVPRGNPLDPVR